MPQQFENPANPAIHREATAAEILRDFPDGVDFLITGVGTGGHITGVSEALKERFPNLQTFAVEPTKSAVISGGEPGPHRLQGIGAGFVPANLHTEHARRRRSGSPRRTRTRSRCGRAREEGIFVGPSSGAALAAVAQKLPDDPGRQHRADVLLRQRRAVLLGRGPVRVRRHAGAAGHAAVAARRQRCRAPAYATRRASTERRRGHGRSAGGTGTLGGGADGAGRQTVSTEALAVNSADSALSPAIEIGGACSTQGTVAVRPSDSGTPLLLAGLQERAGEPWVGEHFTGKLEAPQVAARIGGACRLGLHARDHARRRPLRRDHGHGTPRAARPPGERADARRDRALVDRTSRGLTKVPEHYGAIHFHETDLEDCRCTRRAPTSCAATASS